MFGIKIALNRILGRIGKENKGDIKASPLVKNTGPRRTKGVKEISLLKLRYIPLPPSPPSWELKYEQNKDFHEAYEDPKKRVVLQAYWNKKYNKVVGLIDTISLSEREGEVGHTFLKAYRNLIQRWRNKGNFSVALKWSTQMIDNIPHLITDMDRRRHNKMLSELESTGKKHSYSKIDSPKAPKKKRPRFAIDENSDWSIIEERKLEVAEKPDPSFKTMRPSGSSILFFDNRGQSGKFPNNKSAVEIIDKQGQRIAEKGFHHDIYRLNVPPVQNCFAILSTDCGLYVYDDKLNTISAIDLLNKGEAKNYIRCVCVSSTNEQILYTIVDQAWCIDFKGSNRWAVKLPPKEGWEKVVERVDSFGTSQEIQNALDLMSLAFPIEPGEIKSKYRELAIKWHPDKNPNNPLAHERMQQLNNAYELLTGEKAHLEDIRTEKVHYKKVLGRQRINVPEAAAAFDIEISMMGPGEDWVYASALSNRGGAFLGAYSGKIIEVDHKGDPIRFFDIGCVPSKIIEIEPYLFIQSSTRLYILKNETLCKLIDIFDKGEVVFFQTGFCLLTPKLCQFFKINGEPIGNIITEQPIRRLYQEKRGLVVETRQHRALINNFPSLWL
jgi:DnaJ domain